jgi:hypothetical protein
MVRTIRAHFTCTTHKCQRKAQCWPRRQCGLGASTLSLAQSDKTAEATSRGLGMLDSVSAKTHSGFRIQRELPPTSQLSPRRKPRSDPSTSLQYCINTTAQLVGDVPIACLPVNLQTAVTNQYRRFTYQISNHQFLRCQGRNRGQALPDLSMMGKRPLAEILYQVSRTVKWRGWSALRLHEHGLRLQHLQELQ